MTCGFKRRFAQFVREGSKCHTIREDAGDRWKVGVIVDAFVDPRQKTMERLIPKTPCVKVERVEIRSVVTMSLNVCHQFEVCVDGIALRNDEKQSLAHRDGFRGPNPFAEMMEFWEGRLPFTGKIIHWVYPGEIAKGATE